MPKSSNKKYIKKDAFFENTRKEEIILHLSFPSTDLFQLMIENITKTRK